MVDDGSTDGCDEVCWHYTRQGLPITYVYNDRPDGQNNCCQARNVGIKLAQTDEILVSEPECLFLSDIVAQLEAARIEYPEDVLYGWTLHANEEGAGLENAERMGTFPYYTLYKRDWLIEVGGYDEALPCDWAWDDVDLNGRLAEVGHNTRRIDACSAFHQWHPSRICEAVENEAYVRAKRWPQDIVANVGREWGVLV